ncbi:MAG: hypothetical protein ACP5I3_09045 [Thermoproteus sp.]
MLSEVDCGTALQILREGRPGSVVAVSRSGGAAVCLANKSADISETVCELAYAFCANPSRFAANPNYGTYKFRKTYKRAVKELLRRGLAAVVLETKKSIIVTISDPHAVCQVLKYACWSL